MLKTIISLENMLLEIDKAYDIVEPLSFFWKLYSDSSPQILGNVTDNLAREGYTRVRKIIATPTRKLFINPELIVRNRSLRKEGDNML
uniref:Uncharacterized protein n=1 Tax=Panagrolaimus davidi TaxID=227884 RepID=A0A914PC19_9BILA